MKTKLFLRFLISVISIFLLINCNTKKAHKKGIDEILEKCLECPSDFKFIMLIPSLGCVGCISDAEMFLKENVKNPDFLFVLEEVQSKKSLKIRLGFDFEKSNRIIYLNNRITFIEDFTVPLIYDTRSNEMILFGGIGQ